MGLPHYGPVLPGRARVLPPGVADGAYPQASGPDGAPSSHNRHPNPRAVPCTPSALPAHTPLPGAYPGGRLPLCPRYPPHPMPPAHCLAYPTCRWAVGWHTTQTAAQGNPGAYPKDGPSQRRIPRGNRGPLLALLRLLTRLPAFLDGFAHLPGAVEEEELFLLALVHARQRGEGAGERKVAIQILRFPGTIVLLRAPRGPRGRGPRGCRGPSFALPLPLTPSIRETAKHHHQDTNAAGQRAADPTDWHRSRMRDTLGRYKLPGPNAVIGTTRGSLPRSVDEWNASRPGRGVELAQRVHSTAVRPRCGVAGTHSRRSACGCRATRSNVALRVGTLLEVQSSTCRWLDGPRVAFAQLWPRPHRSARFMVDTC